MGKEGSSGVHRKYEFDLGPLTSARTLAELDTGIHVLRNRINSKNYGGAPDQIVVTVELPKKATEPVVLVLRQEMDAPMPLLDQAEAGHEEPTGEELTDARLACDRCGKVSEKDEVEGWAPTDVGFLCPECCKKEEAAA